MPMLPTTSVTPHTRCAGRRVVLAAVLVLLLFSHPLVHGDGLAHFIYLDSIAGDGDLDLSNQADRFGAANQYHIFAHPATGELVTSFPFGSAYLLAPFYWLGRTLEPHIPAAQVNAAYFHTRQGLSLAFSLIGMLGALCYAAAAVWLTYGAARRIAPDGAAAVAALAGLAGTPMLFYATVEPLGSHVYGAALVALALWLATRHISTGEEHTYGAPTFARALALGLVLGMALFVRWQLLLYSLPVGAVLLWRGLAALPRRQAFGTACIFALGVGLFGALCVLYFRRYFGASFFIPTEVQSGQGFIGAPLRFLPQILFDAQKGWLTWSPVAALGLAGLIALACSRLGAWRVVAAVCLAGIGLELALNSSLHDWFGGWAFGQRRMTEAYAPLVLGMAWLMRGRGLRRGITWGAALLAAAFSFTLFVGHLYYTHTNTEHPAGGTIAQVLPWLATQPHGPPLLDVLRDRYGPWAWARPEL